MAAIHDRRRGAVVRHGQVHFAKIHTSYGSHFQWHGGWDDVGYPQLVLLAIPAHLNLARHIRREEDRRRQQRNQEP